MASNEAFTLSEVDLNASSGSENEMADTYNRELQRRDREHQHALVPPADGGKEAWLFLVGAFCVEGLIWGFPYSFGVFQEYYTTRAPFSEAPSGIASIGTSAMGIMYLGAPFIFALLHRFPNHRRYFTVAGQIITVIALIGASFASKVWHLILTQGVLYAVGGSLLYFPTVAFLDEWFIKRKGFAFGVMWAGAGVSGVCIPFVMTWGLDRYDFSIMLRAWAITLVCLNCPLLFFIKPRIPVSCYRRPLSFTFLRKPTFWIYSMDNVMESLGFFIPAIYLPSYARTLGLSTISGSVAVSLFNAASVLGALILGHLTDKHHVTTAILVSTIGTTFSVFLLWGFAVSLPTLWVFALVYGLSAGGYSCTWTGSIREVKKKDENADGGMIFGLLAVGRGIGCVVTGPLSEALLRRRPWAGEPMLGYGTGYLTGYGGLIVLTGVSALLGGMSWAARRLGWV